MTLSDLEKIDGLFEYYRSHTFKEACEKFNLPFTMNIHAKMGVLWPKNGPHSIKAERAIKKFSKFDTSHVSAYTGTALRRIRKERGLSIREIANFFGVGYVYVATIERGKMPLTKERIYELSCLFNVSPAEFFPPLKSVTCIE